MKNMQKLLILLSTTAMSSTGALSLMTNQNIGNSITNINNSNLSRTYVTITTNIGQHLNLNDANGLGTKEIEIEFVKDVAQYKIDTSDILLTNLVTSDGKAINSESALFLLNELNIDSTDDIFDYNYLKSVEAKISNIKCDVVHEYYDDENHFTVEDGTYVLNFIDKDGKTLGQGNYETKAKEGTSGFFNMIEGNPNNPFIYENFVYPRSPIETFRPYETKNKLKSWINSNITVPLINEKIPSSVKKFLSYQELIGWQVNFKVERARVSIFDPIRFQPGDELFLSINFIKEKDTLVYPKQIKLTLTNDDFK